jgi:hypothetical protein
MMDIGLGALREDHSCYAYYAMLYNIVGRFDYLRLTSPRPVSK